MLNKANIELVHFQLTKNCNLRCWFCGQWGKKGFFSDDIGEEMTLSDWLAVIEELKSYPHKPDIMLWGGEPLVYPHFREVVQAARKEGFNLGIVTNGVKIHEYADILKTEFKHIYVSVDGTREIHDKIRGEGVFDTVKQNLELLRGTNAKISIMSVISGDNKNILDEMVQELLTFNCGEIILQDMIGVSKSEAEEYKAVMQKYFGIKAQYINSWITDAIPINADIPIHPKVYHIPHGDGEPCKSANSHVHIAWNGNVLYCTDFYDFSAGNVKNEKLIDIFNNEKSEKYRQMIRDNKNPTCRHCSWRKSDSFKL